MRCWFVIAALAGCSFEHGKDMGGNGGDDAPGDVSGARDIPHVPASHETITGGDYTFAVTTIDTTAGAIQPPPPEGVIAGTAMQEPSGGELFVIRAHSITIPAAIVVSVTGTRPLVLIADTITITGLLDVGAHADVAGPGGMGTLAMATAPGHGANGTHTGVYQDSGGGGGAYATQGADGGAAGTGQSCQAEQANGGMGGGMFGSPDLAVLAGGAAGGTGSSMVCMVSKIGAGGGAVQVSALTSITITGAINAGGGGGGPGLNCGGTDTGAAAGGGAGGAIYVDAPMIMLTGVIAANGGGGGGGASSAPGTSGTVGTDGAPSMMYASGGMSGGSYGANGGRGAAGASAATAGGNNSCDGNGGGGGGGVGRIVLHAPTGGVSGSGVQSPAATLDTTGF